MWSTFGLISMKLNIFNAQFVLEKPMGFIMELIPVVLVR